MMAANITVRPSTPAEASRLAEIYVETWRTTYAGMLPDNVLLRMSVDQQTRRWRGYLDRPEARETVLTAEAVGQGAIGFGSAGPARRTGPQVGEVYTLYVLPDWQGQGAGRKLMEALFSHLRAADFTEALIWVVAANPSRFFYEAMGGQRTVERIERLWGVELAEIGYRWDLV
jgi:GNAT superfamily N-acetyltransferase